MREKMKEKELWEEGLTEKCERSYADRILATLNGARGKCSIVNEKFSLWVLGIVAPYLLGFILITVLCFSLVDISLGSYFTILADNFSVFGLWTIGYFLLSTVLILYLFTAYVLDR